MSIFNITFFNSTHLLNWWRSNRSHMDTTQLFNQETEMFKREVTADVTIEENY